MLRLVIPISFSKVFNVLWCMMGALFFLLQFLQTKTHTSVRCYLDKIHTGFLTWSQSIKGYKPVLNDKSRLSWERQSLACLEVIKEGINKEGYIHQLSSLWSQESSKAGNTLDLRPDNPLFFKYMCMWFLNLPYIVY